MFLLVGLGNPGSGYRNNRHNIGFKVLENLEKLYNLPKFTKKFKSNSPIDPTIDCKCIFF